MLNAISKPSAECLKQIKIRHGIQKDQQIFIEFIYPGIKRDILVSVELFKSESLPRPANFAINNNVANRKIRLDDYAMFLE